MFNRKKNNKRSWILFFVCIFIFVAAEINHADMNFSDLNGDGFVDLKDFQILSHHWLESDCDPSDQFCSRVNITADGQVDLNDLDAFSSHWLADIPDIQLEIYSDGWGTLLDTMYVEEEGEQLILLEDPDPYYGCDPSFPSSYYVYMFRQGYYTETENCPAEYFPEIDRFIFSVNADLDPIVPGVLNGTIFLTQWYFADSYLKNTHVHVIRFYPSAMVAEFNTDAQGRFTLQITPGIYYFDFTYGGYSYHEQAYVSNTYQDYYFESKIQALKPNIYIYPTKTMDLDVTVNFPLGGEVCQSIPEYNEGWHITVEPSGLIDGEYRYLYYESIQADRSQYERGWVVAKENLEAFFRTNLAQTGFSGVEIEDFIAYWINESHLPNYPYYAIYPQYTEQLDQFLQLQFSTPPDNLIRLIYSIRGLNDNRLNLTPPNVPPFSRNGYTILEWGVILK